MIPSGLSPTAHAPTIAAIDDREYVLGHRQMAAIGFVVVGLIGFAAAAAYLAGRASAPSMTVTAIDSNPAPKLVVAAAVVDKPGPASAAAAVVPAAAVAAPIQPTTFAPVPGSLFYQVACTEPGEAASIATRMKSLGLTSWTGEGPAPGLVRVYAGPANDTATQVAVRGKIEAAGFKPFLKGF